jgi:hypothetical protein
MRLHRASLSATAAVIVSALGVAAYHYIPEDMPTPVSGKASVVQEAARAATAQPVPTPATPRATVQSRPEFPA